MNIFMTVIKVLGDPISPESIVILLVSGRVGEENNGRNGEILNRN
jgi:hypothetical protein